MGNLLEELKRRKVYRVSAIYAVVAWSLIQIGDIVLPTFNAPQWVNQALILALLAGFPLVAMLAWMFEFSASGIKKTKSDTTTENVVLRKRDYFSAGLVLVLVALVITQQVFLLTRQPPEQSSFSISETGIDPGSDLIGQILREIDAGNNVAAFRLALTLEQQQPDNPLLADLWPRFTTPGTVLAMDSRNVVNTQNSDPESLEALEIIDGAEVWLREYSAHDSEWLLLGTTPLNDFPLPNGSFRLRLEQPGYSVREFASINPSPRFTRNAITGSRPSPFLLESIDEPENMIVVPPLELPTVITGFGNDMVSFGAYLIDQYEVSNSQFQEFVDQGGYEQPALWKDLEFTDNGEVLSWSGAMARFVDSTGRSGPAGWELGHFLPGTENFPVVGISWFEAVAYSRFRNKELPTIHHWARAAYVHNVFLGTPIVQEANFSGATKPVNDTNSVSPWGAYNMAGNVREWTFNPQDDQRWVLGGAWNDPSYMSTLAYSLAPMTRDNVTGFRLASYPNDFSIRDELKAEPVLNLTDYRDISAPSDDVYAVLSEQFTYSSDNITSETEYSIDSNPNLIEEKIYLNTSYDDSRFAVHVFTPKTSGPYDPVIMFYGSNAFTANAANMEIGLGAGDFIINSGRALVVPVFTGSFDRYDGYNEATAAEQANLMRERLFRWRTELGRVLDYLQSRGDMTDNAAHLGISFGASIMTPLLALEPRMKTAVLVIGGFSFRETPSTADPLNYVSHITQPTLMLNGRLDSVFPLESRVIPFFEMLGTDPEHKRLEIFDGGHSAPPRNEFVREVIDWLDRYQ